MKKSFTISVARAIAAPMAGALLLLSAACAEPAMSPAEAADDYAATLSQMIDAIEALQDAARARDATWAMAEATRERIRQQSAVEAMAPAARAAYARLLGERAATLHALRARLDAALARMMADPTYVQALAANAGAPGVERP
jgi:methionine synthase II (cobalamin-independent)